MDATEIAPRLWRWTAPHPAWEPDAQPESVGDWPEEVEPSFAGYSIGRWIDEDGDGRFDVLEVETRYMKGPRSFDATGIPLHSDNKTVAQRQ